MIKFSLTPLAHGALGNWDELILSLIALFFVVMFYLSWRFSGGSIEPEVEEVDMMKGEVKQGQDDIIDEGGNAGLK